MDLAAVQVELAKRFAQPLPQYDRRHIVFWQDPEGEFREEIASLDLPDVRVLVLDGHNSFMAKKLLTVDDTEHNFLVYVPFRYEQLTDNWLLDIELMSQPPFHADLVSSWLQELHIPETQEFHDLVARYRRFFQAKERRQKFAALLQGNYTPARFILGLMGVTVGAGVATPEAILRQVLAAGDERTDNTCYAQLQHYGLDDMFWRLAHQATGYQAEEKPALSQLLVRIFVLASDYGLGRRLFTAWEPGTVQQQTFCYDLLTEWQQSGRETFGAAAHYAEQMLAALEQLEQVRPHDLCSFDLFPCVDVAILRQVMRDVLDNLISPEDLQAIIEARRPLNWQGQAEHGRRRQTDDFYEGLSQYAAMRAFFDAHALGFHAAQPQELWQAYTSAYYRMDAAYRMFHVAFARVLENQQHPQLDDLFKQLAERAEDLYANWYLGQLGENWSRICAQELAANGFIEGIPRQEDFYATQVQGQKNRIFVIISDALRYEVAASLATALRQEMPSEVQLTGCQGIFPTITKFGMAALLPHQQLGLSVGTHGYSVLADGQSTEAGARTAVLQSAQPRSVALRYRQIREARRAERQAMVQGQEVVYIYHDTIDAASHTDDTKVFPACSETIDELKALVRIIVNDFGGAHVIITADHGFLYTYRPLQEDSKVARGVAAEQTLDVGRRYLLARQGASPENLLPVRFLQGTTDYEGFAPRESIRLKLKGAGMNYVHGGISLQEMVVPVIAFQHVRASSVRYQQHSDRYAMKPVGLQLLTASRTISNMAFSLKFYQPQPVGGSWQAAVYDICLVDSQDNAVSDTQRIIADKTSTDAPERTYRCAFRLKDGTYDAHVSYYLVIRRADTQEACQREPMQVAIAYEHNEIDFFS